MKRLLLALTAVAVGWGAVEVAGRMIFGLAPDIEDRIALFTSPNWVSDGRGVRWAPDARIRTVAVYGDRIEYDVRFATNDLGYIDHRDYGSPTSPTSPTSPAGTPVEDRWAFVGDSFTAGYHGGDPWVPALRDTARRRRNAAIEIYNLGVSGVGLVQFLPNLNAADRQLDFGQIVFLFISDDFSRKPWRPIERDGRIVLCPSGVEEADCARSNARLFVLDDPEASSEEIFQQLRRRGLLASGPRAWLERRSLVAAALARDPAGEPAPTPGIDARDWLAQLARRYGDRTIYFLQIPEKREVETGALRVQISDQIRAAGHRYVSLLEACNLQPAHYFERDPHLRAAGLDELSDCVGRALGLL